MPYSNYKFPSLKNNNEWCCKYCSQTNTQYDSQCKRCGKGVAPELFLPSRNRLNPFVLIAFFFMIVMILIFSRLPAKNMKALVSNVINKNQHK